MVDLSALQRKPVRYVVGLMSGTSSDGVDAVLVRIKGAGESLAMKLLAHQHLDYSFNFRTRLLSEHMDAKEVCVLNFEIGERLAEAANAILDEAKKEKIPVDFIASHGHTIAHLPPPAHEKYGTLQIGEAAVIAQRTGLPVVSDFRPADMAAGGQGAPLVTYADWILFHKSDRTLACLNLGGIANFTVVTPALDEVLAFDTGPCNMVIDGTVRQLSKGTKEYDRDGKAAKDGIIIDEFMEYLLSHRYFAKVPPKSTGRDDFGMEPYLRDALTARREHSFDDIVATVTNAVSRSIINAYKRFIEPQYEIRQVIVAGGGANNKTLLSLIQKGLTGVPVFTSDQYGIPLGAREAVAFAILGNETICGYPSNVPSATGAKKKVLLGKITLP
jgi:anhydro-N-acetylmuramic acid kinase